MMRIIALLLSVTLACCLQARNEDDQHIRRECVRSLARFTQYAKGIYTEAGVNARGDSLGYFQAWSSGKSNEDGVRSNLDIAMVCAFLYHYMMGQDHTFMPTLPPGIRSDDLRRMSLHALRYACSTHHTTRLMACTDGKYWGTYQDADGEWHHQWESSLWALSLAFTSHFLDDYGVLSEDEREIVARILSTEADFQLSRPVPTGYQGDTKAEENGWEANVLAVAWAMQNGHPHARQWEEAMIRYGMNGYTVDADADDPTMMDGKQVKDWYAGTNLYPDYTLQNHNYFHTSYQNVVMQEQAETLIATCLLNTTSSQKRYDSLTWHWEEVWEQVLAQLALIDGELAMPNGNDWSMFLYDQLPAYAAMACIKRNPDALMLELRCLEQLIKRQHTTTDGSYMLNSDIGPRRMGVTAHRVMMTYLLHTLFPTREVAATEWDDFVTRHSKAMLFPHQNIVRAMTKDRFTCFSWSEGLKNITGCIVPNNIENCKIMIPFKKGHGGNLMGTLKEFPEKPEIQTDGDAWMVRGVADGQPFLIWSTPGNAVIVLNRPTSMALSYDKFTKEERDIQQGEGWMNIDQAIGIVSAGTDGAVEYTIGEQKQINSIGTRILTANTLATVYFSKVTAEQTRQLAKNTRIKRKGNTLSVKTQDPDGRKYRMKIKVKKM